MNGDTAVYTDFSGLAELKAKAAGNASGAVSEVARQFESLLMGQMLKSMRQASLGEGILDNDQSRFYLDMFDRQISLHLTQGGGIGLAAEIERQLGGQPPEQNPSGREIGDYARIVLRPAGAGKADDNRPEAAPIGHASAAPGPAGSLRGEDPGQWTAGDFVERLWPWALEAAGALGLEPQALLAQAALETGWGQHIMRNRDGSPSHNLFGIKADRGWQGARVNLGSLEYEEGLAVRKRSSFRAYDSYRDSFRDYVDFLHSNPRYSEALGSTGSSRGYFRSLQRAGYATDPNYAEKIDAVLHGQEMKRAVDRFKRGMNQPL